MTDNARHPDHVPAALPMDALLNEVTAAQAAVEKAAATPVTIADVAAAAFVALETIVNLLSDENAAKVIAEYEQRSAAFAASMEVTE